MAERDRWLGRHRWHLRLRFLDGESTGSYVTRLAARNLRPVEDLLMSMGVGPMMPVDPQYTEMYVSRYARERLAAVSGSTVPEMQQRLASLRDEFLMRDGSKEDWEWPWDARAGYLVQACSLCAARRGTCSPAWLILADPWHVCVRHGRWTDNSRSTQASFIDLTDLTEVVRAQRQLNRVLGVLGPAGRWVFADAYSILVRSGYLEDPGASRPWFPLAARLGEQRVRPLAQFTKLVALTRDLAWLESRRLRAVLDQCAYREWLPRVMGRHSGPFAEGLHFWHRQHRPLDQNTPLLFDGTVDTRRMRRLTGHAPAPYLASVEDSSCLPWVRTPNTMERLFL